MRRSSESAIALVMTLVMLSVITVMAVAFLALTQRERIAVSQSTQQGDAEVMSDAAAQRAMAEIFARYLAAGTNLNAVDLLVSRNYIRTNGFIPGDPDLANVNYEYTTSGGPLNNDDALQNLANLYYDPRPPVFVNTNFPGAPEIEEFRFYLDLNRNRRFDTNGAYPIMDDNGRQLNESMDFVGDPEWIGVLEHPLFPHSRTNRFVGRYAYIALPIGKSLDVNFIYNHGKHLLQPNEPGFYRDQGVGSWELNLAAFLADLNTNLWNPSADYYLYDTNLNIASQGVAFRDANDIYNTRLTSFQNLAPADQVLNPAAIIDFTDDFIDQYADGLLDNTGRDNDVPSRPWPGAYNWTNFFTPHDFFDIFRVSTFPNRLSNAGLGLASYDRYTYYRMLAQFSSDSAAELPRANIQQLHRKVGAVAPAQFVAEPAGKININYDNLDYPVTEMMPWEATKFFTNVANVLLGSVNLSVTNIPIYPTNYYGVTVHRMLQMAANIYDSTTSNRFPSVFRPNVVRDSTNVYINGYYYDDDVRTVNAWLTNSYGLPMILGAKKCIPNFNQYEASTVLMAARKLQMLRRDTNSIPYQTNEMFIIGVSNIFGLEAWNSCTQAFQGPLEMLVANNVTVGITNSEGLNIVRQERFSVLTNLAAWEGFTYPNVPDHSQSRRSFKVPLDTNSVAIQNSIYRFASPPYLENISRTNFFVPNSGFRTPDWQFTISNHLVYVLSITNRILDFVQFANLTNHIDLGRDLMNGDPQIRKLEGDVARCWSTNRPGASPGLLTPTEGIQAQIDISLGNPSVGISEWKDFSFDTTDKEAAIRSFNEFVFGTGNNTNLIMQAPFTPARKMVVKANWEVNDPLVHHIEDHLKDNTNSYSHEFLKPFIAEVRTNQTLGRINSRYQPWGGPPTKQPQPWDIDPAIKDPGILKSDDWDFPTNRFPSIGWLGRVHRGTPWQTIYLKADAAPENVWRQFSMDPLSHPTNDWRLLDVFTTAIHPNASHGQLSVNQTNFAAWSAVLSGVVAITNTLTLDANDNPIYLSQVIEPGSPQLLAIYEGIQKRREQLPDKTFRRLGDLLSVRELSQGSPFINRDAYADLPYPHYGITDTVMERIPQQILSLVKVGDPRFVIYAYGQALRPAEDSILTSGTFMGMCTNYQITGEFVTRTVFQIEGTAGQPRPVVKAFNILSAE